MQYQGCKWDPNHSKCRSSTQCDYNYASNVPRMVAYSVSEDPVMNTACYDKPNQCYRGHGNVLEHNVLENVPAEGNPWILGEFVAKVFLRVVL
jgi:hypothetical protein